MTPAIEPISVSLSLSQLVQRIEIDDHQLGDGSRLLINQLDVTDQVSLTVKTEQEGAAGQLIASMVLEEGSYVDLPIELPLNRRLFVDTTYWLEVFGQRKVEPETLLSITIDLDPLLELDLRPQYGYEFQAKINRIQVSEPVEITLHAADDRGLPSEEVIYRSETIEPGSHRNLKFGQPIPARESDNTVHYCIGSSMRRVLR